jgi:tetratricopeptide (TPR) repeat protein
MQIQINKEKELKVGVILMKRTQYSESLTTFLKITHDNPKHIFDTLIPIYNHLLLHFNNNHLRIMITELYLSQKYDDDAISELEDAFRINPHFSQIYLILAKIYNKTIYKKRIKSLFESAIDQNIYDSSIIDLLPKLYFEEKNTTKNIQLFEKLIAYTPQKLHYYKIVAELYKSVQQYDKASQIITQMATLSPTLASDAAKFCNTMTRLCPMNFSLRQTLITLLWKACEPEKAHTQIQELCRIDTSYIPIAIKNYKHALLTFPHDKDLSIGIATLLIETQDYSESITYIQDVYQFHPDNTTPLLSLLHTILDRYPTQVCAIKLCITLYLNQEKTEKCLTFIEQLINANSPEYEFIKTQLIQITKEFPTFTNRCKLLHAQLKIATAHHKNSLPLLTVLKTTEFNIQATSLEIQVYIKLDDLRTAQRLALDALKKYPEQQEFHTLLATLQKQLITKKLNTIPITSEKDHFEIGLLLLRKSTLYPALEKFQNISTDSEFNLKSHVLISRCFLELGKYNNATNYISRCLDQLSSTDKEQRCQLLFFNALINIQSGNYKNAVSTMESILSININYPHITTLLKQYKSIHLIGFRGLALSLVKTHLTTPSWHIMAIPNPEELNTNYTDKTHISFALPHNNQGALYLIEDNFSAAKAEFKLAQSMDPSLTISYTNLAIIYLLEKKYDQSLKQLDKAHELNPTLTLINQLKGLTYQEMNQPNLAIQQFQKALHLTPQNFIALINLGDLYFQSGRLKLAFSIWKKTMESPLYFYLLQRRLLYLKTGSIHLTEWICPIKAYANDLLGPFQSLLEE